MSLPLLDIKPSQKASCSFQQGSLSVSQPCPVKQFLLESAGCPCFS